ncbi:MAG: 30S ribosomal protein S16 [bacterium]|nr:30S ribosomal protein S16 [bacterium]
MLKIKLTRLGKKAEPRYRIVVNECRDKRDGQVVDTLGFYQPAEKPKKLELNIALFEEWLKKGAQPTETVAFLYDVAKKGKGFPEGKPKLSKKAKAKAQASKEEAAPAAEPVAEVAEPQAEEQTAAVTE